jgi:hypothetical protein
MVASHELAAEAHMRRNEEAGECPAVDQESHVMEVKGKRSASVLS